MWREVIVQETDIIQKYVDMYNENVIKFNLPLHPISVEQLINALNRRLNGQLYLYEDDESEIICLSFEVGENIDIVSIQIRYITLDYDQDKHYPIMGDYYKILFAQHNKPVRTFKLCNAMAVDSHHIEKYDTENNRFIKIVSYMQQNGIKATELEKTWIYELI